MKSLGYHYHAIGISAVAFVLAACSGMQPPAVAPDVMPRTDAKWTAHSQRHAFKVLYNFIPGKGDAYYPYGGLTSLKNKLYGTTQNGGDRDDGTVYVVSPSGEERVLHSFQGNPDGAVAYSALFSFSGKLYGTTYAGGTGLGIIFETNAAGVEKVLYDFRGGDDGADPYGGPVADKKGNLFVATFEGGQYGGGAVVELMSGGQETTLHSFGSDQDGTDPRAAPIIVDGALYGTTYEGGAHDRGVVYEVTTSGEYRDLYSFGSISNDGWGPTASLVYVNGALYGTTEYGGNRTWSCGNGCGTVFAIDKTGAERIVYRFKARPDGGTPAGGLLYVNGALYGTTAYGGVDNVGTVFKLKTSGEETVLHSFAKAEGGHPQCTLTDLDGALYGTTTAGGSHKGGTVFRIYL